MLSLKRTNVQRKTGIFAYSYSSVNADDFKPLGMYHQNGMITPWC
jgi:hypothetical protein